MFKLFDVVYLFDFRGGLTSARRWYYMGQTVYLDGTVDPDYCNVQNVDDFEEEISAWPNSQMRLVSDYLAGVTIRTEYAEPQVEPPTRYDDDRADMISYLDLGTSPSDWSVGTASLTLPR